MKKSPAVVVFLGAFIFTSLCTFSYSYAQEKPEFDNRVEGILDYSFQKVHTTPMRIWPAKSSDFKQYRISVPDEYADMRVADFNKDGYPDVALLNSSDKKLLILYGDKKQNYDSRKEFKATDAGSILIGPADFNNDGKLDLAMANVKSKKYVSVFAYDKNGKFKKAKSVRAKGSKPSSLQYAYPCDFNNDGKTDIIGLIKGTYSAEGHIVAMMNLGNLKFKAYRIADQEGYDSLAVGDVNGDGLEDFVVCMLSYSSPDTLTSYLSNGNGTFKKAKVNDLKDIGTDFSILDLDNDGKVDIVGNGNYIGQVYTAKGLGDGRFTSQKEINDSGTLAYGMCIQDMDNAKYPEMIASETSGIRMYHGAADRQFTDPEMVVSGLSFSMPSSNCSSSVASEDVDNDKKSDVIGLNNLSGLGSSAPDHYNVMLLMNGEKPAELQISNLNITQASFSIMFATVAGSFDYSGSGLEMRYNADGTSPTDSAFVQMRVYVDLPWPLSDSSVTARFTGEFLHNPNSDSGTVSFKVTLPTGVMVFGTLTPKVLVRDLYLWDYNLVRSNELDN